MAWDNRQTIRTNSSSRHRHTTLEQVGAEIRPVALHSKLMSLKGKIFFKIIFANRKRNEVEGGDAQE